MVESGSEKKVLKDSGTKLALAPGGQAVLAIAFENDSGDPRVFDGTVNGAGDRFVAGFEPKIALGGGLVGEFVVRIAVPADAPAGAYPLELAVLDDGGFVVEPPGRVTATLVVQAPAAPKTEPEPEPEPEPVPPIDEPPAVPPSDPPKRTRTKKPEETVVPPPEATEPPVEKSEPPPREVKEPTPGPRPKVSTGPKNGTSAPRPPVETPPPADRGELEPSRYTKSLRGPKDGDVVELDPGGSVLVVLEFRNGKPDPATFVLEVRDDSRPTDAFPLARIIRDQVNIVPGGTDELAFSLHVPAGSRPQSMNLRVSFGPRGGRLETIRLTLKISPRISVRVAAPARKAVVGPIKRVIDLNVEVANSGNVATAYRLGIKDDANATPEDPPGTFPDTEGQGSWRYLFDKELDDVAENAKQTHRLRLLRTGIWWLGWWETQRVRAVAVPVTDPRNAGEAGNDVELKGVRWRLLPAPWPIAVPLLLLFFAFFLGAFGVRNVRVENGLPVANGPTYVLQNLPVDKELSGVRQGERVVARIGWDAPALSLLKTLGDSGKGDGHRTGSRSADFERPLGANEYVAFDKVWVTSLIGLGGASSPRIVFLPLKTEDAFGLLPSLDNVHPLPMESKYDEGTAVRRNFWGGATNDMEIGGIVRHVMEITVNVDPGQKLYLKPVNYDTGNRIQLWLWRAPKDYDLQNFLRPDNAEQNPGASLDPASNADGREGKEWLLKPREGANSPGQDELWLVSTDHTAQVVRIIVNHGGKAGSQRPAAPAAGEGGGVF